MPLKKKSKQNKKEIAGIRSWNRIKMEKSLIENSYWQKKKIYDFQDDLFLSYTLN